MEGPFPKLPQPKFGRTAQRPSPPAPIRNRAVHSDALPLLISRNGAHEAISLQSNLTGLKLTLDRQRTPAFLDATLAGPTRIGQKRQGWTLEADVLKGKVRGPFPRRGHPLYEDSAIYLKALLPGKSPRSIRIPVRGTANEG